MAPSQSMMTKFLYDGRLHCEDSEFVNSNSCAQVLSNNHAGSGAPALSDGNGDPVLLGASDVPEGVKAVAASDATPEVVILDPKSASPAHDLARAKPLGYEANRQWQDSWAARLPWAESVLGEDGRIRQVRCKICSDVEGRDKLLVPKLDSLWKHCGRRKATTSFGKVKAGDYYFLSNNVHVRNEKIFFARSGKAGDTVVQQVAQGAIRERKRKMVQFRGILWLLMQGRPLAQYEMMKDLFELLGVPDLPKKHWSSMVGWEMADHLAIALADHTKKVISKARFFSLSADEVSTIDSQSWLSIHLYVCIGWKRVPILLSLSRLEDGNGASAVRDCIEGMVTHHSGLAEGEVAKRLVCFGADGVSVFQGSRNGVTTQMRQHMAPFMFGMHCMAHRTNLAVEPLSNLPLVAKVEELCQSMYAYFSHSPKRHLEFQKLADLVETEGRRMLRNVKTRWLSLLEPLKRVMGEYKTLVAKMCEDAAVKEPELTAKQAAAKETARRNYDLLCDVGTMFALPCLMPLLDSVNSLMKFSQSNHVFVSDYIAAVKICQSELYMMYSDNDTAWQKHHFEMFHDLLHDRSYSISQEWVTDLNTGVETLAFRIGGHTYPAHSLCALSGKKVSVTRDDMAAVVSSVKAQCRDAAEMLTLELDLRFPEVELMNALGVVFPQYWL